MPLHMVLRSPISTERTNARLHLGGRRKRHFGQWRGNRRNEILAIQYQQSVVIMELLQIVENGGLTTAVFYVCGSVSAWC